MMEKARILIVEDEVIIALQLKEKLKSLGYDVTSVVNNADDAIKKAADDHPDLVLMDIRIQGDKDGIETAEIVRSKYGIPVIFSTAYLDHERIERAKITMPFGYVLKPIQERDLKVTLEMALYVAGVDAERRKAEKAVKESEQLLREVINSMEKAIAIYEPVDNGEDFRFLETNEFAEKIMHYSSEEVLGKTIKELFPGESSIGLIEKLKETYLTGVSTAIPLNQYKDDRITQWVENYIFRLPSGKVVAMFEDTTEKRKAEA